MPKSTGSSATASGGTASRSSKPEQRPAFAICVEGYAPFLQVGRAYKVERPLRNDPPEMLRVIDAEGEDYLYPRRMFVLAPLPLPDMRRVTRALADTFYDHPVATLARSRSSKLRSSRRQ